MIDEPFEVPRYVFRVYGDQSNGTNSDTFFAPALKAESDHQAYKGMTYDETQGSFVVQLRKALYNSQAPSNPYVFTTSSLLYAIQHAIRKDKKEDNVRIVRIDTVTARTQTGGTIKFVHAPVLMGELSLRGLTARWTYDEIDYSDVWVTGDTVKLGEGSRVASLKRLIRKGLFRLFPEWAINSVLGNPGLEKPVKDLRKLWFAKDEADIPFPEIDAAAKLAKRFRPVTPTANDHGLPADLFAWFLALRNQSADGKNLRCWLHSYSEPAVRSTAMSGTASIDSSDKAIAGSADMPEYQRFGRLYKVVGKRKVAKQDVARLDSRIERYSICERRAAYTELRERENKLEKQKKKDEKQLRSKCRAAKREGEQAIEEASTSKKARAESPKRNVEDSGSANDDDSFIFDFD